MGCLELISKAWGDLLLLEKVIKLFYCSLNSLSLLHWKEVVLQLQLVETGMNGIPSTGFSLEAGITTNISTSQTAKQRLTFPVANHWVNSWTLETRPIRDKMSDLPYSIKNILSGNIAKKGASSVALLSPFLALSMVVCSTHSALFLIFKENEERKTERVF